MLRIVSLCPSNTELLIYLGLEKHLVGIDNYSDWPESIQGLPKLGPDLSIDIEKTAELNPDLVVASLSVPGMEKNIEGLKNKGLSYVVLDPQSLEDIAHDMLTIGKLTGHLTKAIQVSQAFLAVIRDYQNVAHDLKDLPSIYWEWWPKPVFTPGRTNWLTEISQLAGGLNCFSDYPQASVQTNWENVISKNPDHICMVWVGVEPHKVKREFVLKRENSNDIKAVANGHVHVLEEALYCRPSPRLLIGLQQLAALLHPDQFPKYDKKDPLAHFYQLE